MEDNKPNLSKNNSCCDPRTGCCSPADQDRSRREFLKKVALGTGALSLQGLPVFAGPFHFQENEHLIPENKQLSEGWLRSLYERGTPEIFSSKRSELKHIGMPVGGIACGQLYLSGDGRLWLWHIFKTEYGREKDHGQQFSAMTLGGHYQNPDKVFEREKRSVSQGTVIKISQKGKSWIRHLDSSGFDDIEFRGEYPIGKVKYKDPELPVEVQLEAYSPFIPLNAEDSALPATIMTYRIKNHTNTNVEINLGSYLENAVCPFSNVREQGSRRNTLIKKENRLTNHYTAEGLETQAGSEKEDQVFEDFESGSFARWEAEGTAFGASPVQFGEKGYYEKKPLGEFYASSGGARELEDPTNRSTYRWGRILPGDALKGTLTSESFRVTHDYIRFMMAGGYHPDTIGCNLLVDDEVVISITGNNTTRFEERFMDVRNFVGKNARLQLVDQAQGSWASIAIDHIVFTDKKPLYNKLTDQHGFGSMAISLINPSSSASAQLDLTLADLEKGLFDANESSAHSTTSALDQPKIGGVRETITLGSGEEKEISFVISWFFPFLKQQETEKGELLQLKDIKFLNKHYANWFNSADQVADHLAMEFSHLSETTHLWNQTYYDSTLPYWLLDRSFVSIDALATNTMLWFDNGRIYGWEGVECCPGTCQHVWQYAQTMARIFPSMEKTLREVTDYGLSFNADGGLGHRDETAGKYGATVAHDGHCGTVMRTYREHKMSSNAAFLKKHYSKIKKSVQFLMVEDKDKDGLLEGEQHNTLDAAWYGPMGWISSLYIGAMAAGREMAIEVGDLEFAEECASLIEKGKKNLVNRLYNGEYFIHEVDRSHPKAINSNDGCHIDQVLGQSFAWQYGIKERIVPEKECRSALESIWKYNFAPDAFLYQQQHTPIKGARIYATQGEAGTIMCTWPKSNGDTKAVPGMADRDADSEVWLGPGAYFDEAMNGFEYQVATHMIWEDQLEKGLATMKAVHDRYHPLKRNPYNEIECSDHYSRSMASYGILLAVCGYDYHGPKGRISFDPKMNPEAFKAPFTTAKGWGTFSQNFNNSKQDCLLDIKHGDLQLSEIELTWLGNSKVQKIEITLGEREVAGEWDQENKKIRIHLGNLNIQPSRPLKVNMV